MNKFLQDKAKGLEAKSENDRQALRLLLKEALYKLLPNADVYIFGSITKENAFTKKSDIDIALLAEPKNMSLYEFQDRLSEKVGRPVDVLLLSDTRLREKIMQEGELWQIQG